MSQSFTRSKTPCVNSVPADCDTLVVNGTSYRHCNGTWYEPRYSGGDVTYIVVESPQ